jgi:hypothetical protein
MNTNFLLQVFEQMHDRKLASMIAAASAGRVTERTVRNWITKRTTPDPGVLEYVLQGSRETMLNSLEAKERKAFAEGLQACPGFISGFAFTLENGNAEYPAFLQLASQIDLLEQALDMQSVNNNVQDWVETLLAAKWIRDEHLTNPDDGTSAEAIRLQLREAKSWKELVPALSVLVVNTQFQLLATLDLEFCASYLSDWEATPIFASLLPRLDPRSAPFIGTSTTTRDLFHYPTRRLLDVTACVRAMLGNPGRKWPRSMPAVEEMVRWLDLAGRPKLASNLPKWRSGRTLTSARFDDLWNACFSFLPEAERPAAPMAMLYAVTVFTEMFVKGSREDRDLTFISPDPAFYQHWWDIQRQELSAGPQPLRFGTEKWMPGLT